uniref:Stress response kinase A n=1 Tax=uncultured Thiotrichaceae bacterium TaxID=298394 RepID=A0A6S6U7K1_9GAMM|nr:MAG: YihE protein, required for LPS synthesis [uncultured Thiotrichaceae bacterium]
MPETSPPDTDTVNGFHRLSPDQILDAVESLGWVADGCFLALNSYENRVYQVGIEDDEPVIAKFYRPDRWSNEAIREEHAFSLQLADVEIPVVAPLLDASGESLHQHDVFRFALYPRRGGRTPELDDPEQLEVIGRFMARIHLSGEQSDFQHRPSVDIESYGIETSTWLLGSGHLPMGLEQAYSMLIDDLLAKIKDHFSAAGDFKMLRVHGDAHPGNLLWREGQLHIVDFDDARMGPSVQDLWMFLSGDRQFRTARLADVLEGYTQFRDFNPRELHLIEALRTLRIIHYAVWLARRAEDPAFQQAFPWFYTAHFWDTHILTLKEQSAELDQLPLIWD